MGAIGVGVVVGEVGGDMDWVVVEQIGSVGVVDIAAVVGRTWHWRG